MSLLLFDTTFLVDADRAGDQLDTIIDDDDALAAITMAELRVRVALSTGKARATRRAFLDDVLASIPIVDYDRDVAEAHTDLLVAVRRQGCPRGAYGLMIAATARARRTVVTADASAFADLPDVDVRTHR